ncbi:cytochrome b561 and DOMON domain-containing protein At4g12980-like [Pistacia vera]|uniref:cytochrome b561 and DOMON domain-containing protein At4g12980-like n=1 Tax=Pistacia vera TaxID=55513 RepID=UPI001262FC26|nr:cytochrome b561 and DOMON domain-containing protein At4g12980-like [Pistacia vera]
MYSSSTRPTIIFILALFILFPTGISPIPAINTCSEAFSRLKSKRNITQCKKLPTLGAEFGWNYYDNDERRIDIFLGTKLHSEMGWLAWGVNPLEVPQMVGTRAIIGIKLPNGSLTIDTYNITAESKLGCRLQPSNIEIEVIVRNKKTEYVDANRYFTIYATLILPSVYNISRLNHVWQVGYLAEEMEPKMHPSYLQNVDSTETINLKTFESQSIGTYRHHMRMVHGILNIVGWGIFLPIGVIITRYCRVHPIKAKSWYILHVSCQIVGYILGTAGWIIGICLGKVSTHYSFHTHRILAMFIFTFTTLQMLALQYRPKGKDDYRKYWNMYHHFLGYSLLAVISINIFRGISILKPEHHIWKWSYIGVLGVLGLITLFFEIFSWKWRNRSPQWKAAGTNVEVTVV